MSARMSRVDRWLIGSIAALALVLVAVITIFAPSGANDDPRPTTYNPGSSGAKAIYLTLQEMGVPVERWERPLTELTAADAPHTTLVLADPTYLAPQKDELRQGLEAFLKHGGRVLTTGSEGAALLGGATGPRASFGTDLCLTTPEGPGELAAAGSVEMRAFTRWQATAIRYRVEQRCGTDAVVVRFSADGGGQAIWWSAATPMTNGGLKNDANLRLLLASLGPDLGHGRRVLFDESLRTARESMWDYAKGLPLVWIAVQTALVGALLLFSYSRRRGPLRMPVALPRSSPVEFAESMGDLYAKAGAQIAAITAARRRLERALMREAGLQQATVAQGPAAIAEALTVRLGGDWSALGQHLEEAIAAEDRKLTSRSALHIVRALHEDEVRLNATLHPEAVKREAEENVTANSA